MTLFGRAVVPWRAALLAAVLSVSLSLALVALLAGGHAAPLGSSSHDGLASLPAAAQGPVSATLGREGSSYRVHAAPGGFAAASAGQRLGSRFGLTGVEVRSGSATVGLSLGAIGYGDALGAVTPVMPRAEANRVLYAHAQAGEWYANGPLGLEQGFTVPRAPSAARSGPLTLSLTLSGNTRAELSPGGRSVNFSNGTTQLRYGQLVATDASGRTLNSSMQLSQGHLLLHVDDRAAVYPLRIDPLVQASEALTVSEAAGAVGEGQLGFSVALSADGNTALVGAPADANSAGAVWMFVRSSGSWKQEGSKLTAGEPGGAATACGEEGGPGEETEECSFGRSIAISADGKTALIGGPRRKGPCRTGECHNQGAAWVFTRTGSDWTLQSTLTGGSEESIEGRFGRSVALSGDGKTAVIGAPANSSGGGAAFVFGWDGSSWVARAKLTGGAEEKGLGFFGRSVALSADGATALVGAPGDSGFTGAAWVFYTANGEEWTQQGGKLVGAGEQGEARFAFGVALSQDGTTALVGGRRDNEGAGAAWLFARPASAGEQWPQQGPKLTGGPEEGVDGEFGYDVALSADGSSALIGAPHDNTGAGAAWLFARTSEGLTVDGTKLTGGEPRKGWFGSAVALSSEGKTALIGAPKDGSKAGSVWVFADPATIPLLAGVSPSAGSVVGGTSVTISGSRLAGTSKVEFGGVEASFTVNSASSITAIAPAHTSGSVRVVVTTPEGRSQGGPGAPMFTYVQPPGVSELSPAEGPVSGGTPVTITGSHLGGTTAVSFGSVPATSFTVVSSKTITAVSPPEAAGTVNLTVATPGGVGKSHFTFLPVAGHGSEGGGGSSPGSTAGGSGGGGVLGFGPLCSASLLSRSITVLSRSRAAIKLSWRGSGNCAGTLKLSVRVKAGKRVKTKTIGTGRFTIAGGRTRTVTVTLNRLGRSLLAAGHGRLGASLVIVSVSGTASTPRTASVRLALQKKSKPKAHGK
ncbi:MAG TPA: IPT/TIG domain-containing protein [Solirubrobacteraceae bacterium]|nr:IPT/TIG domain-containing protein [Solirubrobacteraceae bacterium]